MAHIVCITSGLRGLLNASFELLRRLEADGHEVSYACPHDVRESVEAQGLRYTQLPAVNFDPAPAPARADGSLGARLDEWRSAGARRAAGIEAMNLSPFRDFIERETPDLVLIDVELYEHIFTLHELGTPFALISPFFSGVRAPGVPPLPTAVLPGKGWRGSTLGLALAWWRRRAQRYREIKTVSLRNAFTERRSVLKTMARKVGYPLSRLEEYGSHTLFTDNHLPVLHLSASELEFGQSTRRNAHYVGPMVARQRVDQSVTPADAERLAGLFHARRSDGGVLLYCSLTTMNVREGNFLERVINAVAGRPDWTLIVGHGGAEPAAAMPDNVHLFRYVPQLDVLDHVDACITYGGMNTVHECLITRTPMLVYPQFNDQPGVAARLVHHQLGHRGEPETDDAAVIARRLHAVLEDQALRERLTALRETLQRYEDDNTVARVVNSLLR